MQYIHLKDVDLLEASSSQSEIIGMILEEAREWFLAKGIKQWPYPFSISWIKEHIADGQFHIANYSGMVVGVFRLLWADPIVWGNATSDAVYIHSLAVRRRFAGHGIGYHILSWTEEYAREKGKRYLRLNCIAENSNLCNYYRQAGFISCGVREVYVDGIQWTIHLFEKDVHLLE